jgi:excisionase family DNA binding protein
MFRVGDDQSHFARIRPYARRPWEDAVKNATESGERLLTPAEVAAMFRVDPKTVTRWAKAGKLSSIRTLGGHRRYRESEIKGLLQESITGRV